MEKMDSESALSAIALQLKRVADSLDVLARPGKDYAPDYIMPIEEYRGFEWDSINANVVKSDRDGPTHIQWNGQVYTRRSPSNKFDPAIWFSRSTGRGEDGETTSYARLITFREIKDADPLPEKARGVVDRHPVQQAAAQSTAQPAPHQETQQPAKKQTGPLPQLPPNQGKLKLELVSYTEYMAAAKRGNITSEAAQWIAKQANVSPDQDHSVPHSYLTFFYEAKHAGLKLSEAWKALEENGFDPKTSIARLPV